MSEAERVEVENPPENEAGFCRPFTEEQLEQIPPVAGDASPAPPMANVALAVELTTGLDSTRDFDFHGVIYQVAPTSYPTAIRLLIWTQQLERLTAMREVLHEHLPELRQAYAEIASLTGSLLVDQAGPNPFLEATPADYQRLIRFALESGNEVVVKAVRSGSDVVTRYDASYYLYAYLAAFGAIPGMVVLQQGRPCPASWRHFTAGMSYLRRAEAERSLQMYGAVGVAQSGEETQEQWLAMQKREAGQG